MHVCICLSLHGDEALFVRCFTEVKDITWVKNKMITAITGMQ